MTIEQITKKADQINDPRWLEKIAAEYETAADFIEKNRDTFTITGIGYECRSDSRVLHINPHRPISPIPVRSALLGAAQTIRKEIAELKTKIESE